jgi:hypothetical protein
MIRKNMIRTTIKMIWKSSAVLAFAVLCMSLSGQGQTVNTPPWLTWLGNGNNSFSCTTGTCTVSSETWFSSFSVSSGATVVNVGGNGPLIIRSTGACSIQGSVVANGSNNLGGGITGDGDFGGSGGGGGGAKTVAGIAGKGTQVISGIPLVNGGLGGAIGGGTGQNGGSPGLVRYQTLIDHGSAWPSGGAPGGRGGSGGGVGGDGGEAVVFVCNSINFTGSIDVSGQVGAKAPQASTGGGGGGGGGYAVLAAVDWIANTGTINVSGGVGGGCGTFTSCGPGGNGGNGWSTIITIH